MSPVLKHYGTTQLNFSRRVTGIASGAVVPLLANRPPFTHNSRITLRGNHVCHRVGEFPVRFAARNRVFIRHAAGRGEGLHPRAGTGVHERCVSAVQCRDSGCRPRHGLHGQEQIAAQSRLPRPIQTRARGHGHPGGRRAAAQHQAGIFAKARQRQGAKAQEAGQAGRDLSLQGAFFGSVRSMIASGCAVALTGGLARCGVERRSA
jgi:hypothetical protein